MSSAPPSPSMRELGDDHLGLRARGELDRAQGVGGDLELEVGAASDQRVLQLCEAVGGVAEQDGDSHLCEGIGRA